MPGGGWGGGDCTIPGSLPCGSPFNKPPVFTSSLGVEYKKACFGVFEFSREKYSSELTGFTQVRFGEMSDAGEEYPQQ